ncbi:MAG: hypothetical protein U1E27_07880 [Kiritimatiellia bacterium]|nr:hypothetical protein [Kiritimatiellia bacterium]
MDASGEWFWFGGHPNGAVRQIVRGEQNSIYVTGSFTEIDGVEAARIAKWRDGEWKELGAGFNSVPQTIVFDHNNNDLYVGGAFTNTGGGIVNKIARWNGSAWLGCGSGIQGPGAVVRAMALGLDGALYVGGTFTNAGGVRAHNVAKWWNGSWSAMGDGLSLNQGGAVFALAVDGTGALYAGGVFTNSGGASLRNIARWNGSRWVSEGGGFSNAVRNIAFDSLNRTFIGINESSNPPSGVHMFDGTNWLHVVSNRVRSIAIDASDKLYVGSESAPYIADLFDTGWDNKFYDDGTLGGVNGSVDGIMIDSDGRIYIGGAFTRVGANGSNIECPYLALYAPDYDNDGLPNLWEYEHFGSFVVADPDADADDDGLSNIEEYYRGTDPNNPDTDGDGMPDGWEVVHGLNPLANDAANDLDGDGLRNLQEYLLGTRPDIVDTDGDGLSDYEEYVLYGTSPLDHDSDGDGMPDGWEISHGLNPLVNDANEDLNLDWLTNLENYLNNLNPRLYSTHGGGTSDYVRVHGKTGARFYYDANDRLVGVEYQKGRSIGYVYDAAGRRVREVHLERDQDGDGLPDIYEFLVGLDLTDATGDQGHFGDASGNGWSNYQEWQLWANSQSIGVEADVQGVVPQKAVSFRPSFSATRFSMATGRLAAHGEDVIVVGADGNPNGATNEILILSQSFEGWTTQRVDVGVFGITSIAIGQPTNAASPAIFLGTRQTAGPGEIVRVRQTGSTWAVESIATSSNGTTYVLGVRPGQDVLVSLATTTATNALSSLTHDGTAWQISTAHTNTSHRGLGVIAGLTTGVQPGGAIRLLDSGGIQYAESLASAILVPEPVATNRLLTAGRSLAAGGVRGVNTSFFYMHVDDLNASGTVDAEDVLVLFESEIIAGSGVSRTHKATTLHGSVLADDYALATVNLTNGNGRILFTAEPDGGVYAWRASSSTGSLTRTAYSLHQEGTAWHDLTSFRAMTPGEGMAGLNVDPADSNECRVMIWQPAQALWTPAMIPQTAPITRILPAPDRGGGVSVVNVRVWDAEANRVLPFLQYRNSDTLQWRDATILSINGEVYSESVKVAAAPTGTSHTLLWDSANDLDMDVAQTVLLRMRAKDISLWGDWSEPVSYRVERISHELTVTSAHGEPAPAVGTNTYDWGTVLTASVASPVTQGTTRYVATGWRGTGSVPELGTETSLSFTLTQDSTLTWLWRTEYQLVTSVAGNGIVDVADSWHAVGAEVLITATAADYHHFNGWSGDTEGCTIAANRITVPMTQSRVVTANFAINTYAIAFDLGGHGVRTGGGALEQVVPHGGAAVAPEVEPLAGWRFLGWDAPFDNVTEPMTVAALYQREDPFGSVVGYANETMTVFASALVYGHWAEPDDVVGAFVDDELRGKGRVELSNDIAVVELEIHLAEEDEVVYFRIWQAAADAVLDFHETLNGIVGGTAGDLPDDPFPLTVRYRVGYEALAGGAIEGDSVQHIIHGADASPVVAQPAFGHHFVQWNDGLESPTRQDTNVQEHLHVTANFAINTYAIAFDLGGRGVRTGGGALEQVVPHGGAAVVPEVEPAAGWSFIGWDAAFDDVTEPMTVTAQYEPILHDLTVASAHGEPDPAVGTHSHAWGTEVPASVASPVTAGTTRHVATGWSGTGSVPESGAGSSVTFTLTEDSELTWLWRTEYWLASGVEGNGSVDMVGGWHVVGAEVLITATAAEHHHFTGWSGDTEGSTIEGNRITIPMTRARSLTANFTINTYAVSYSAGPGGSIAGESVQQVPHGGSSAPVSAIPDAGARWHRWSDGRVEGQRIDSDVADEVHVVALFKSESGVPLNWYANNGFTPGEGENWTDVENRDPHNKGMTLRDEFIAETDPTDPKSLFRVTVIEHGSPPVIIVEPSSPRRIYTLQYRASLTEGDWQDVPEQIDIPGGGDPLQCLENAGAVFYRVIVNLP